MALLKTVFWQRLDLPGSEVAQLKEEPDAWVIEGVVLVAIDCTPARLEYRVQCDRSWQTTIATVQGTLGERTVSCDIHSDTQGHWWLNGVRVPAVDGALDVDLAFTPSTNLLPLRRAPLAEGETMSVRAAWLTFPAFRLGPLDQSYQRLGDRRYHYRSSSFEAELMVDELGLMVRYGDVWIAKAEA